jgi:hypothetical protein
VVDGTALCEVDLLALEHVVAELLDLCLLGKLDKEGEGLLSDEVLGEIEDNVVAIGLVAEDMAELVEALGVWRKIEVSVLDVTDDKGGKVKGIPLTLSELLLQHNGATKPAGRD